MNSPSLFQALKEERPLQIVGVMNAFLARLAKDAGFKALYLSGAAVANFSFALPDIGMVSLDNTLEEVRRITDAVDLPLLVDIDTGWGSLEALERGARLLFKAGAAALQIEDQPFRKKCGHLENKQVVDVEEMCARIKTIKKIAGSTVLARTDALAVESLDKCIERVEQYVNAGADMLFIEAVHDLKIFEHFKFLAVPLLVNLTEFGKTSMVTKEELKTFGIDMALYPLTIARVMNESAWHALRSLRINGSQKELLPLMMTRDELYRILNYKES